MKKSIALCLSIGLSANMLSAQWTDISIPTNKALTDAVFIDDLHGFVASENYNTLWRTSNGGVTWDSTDFGETVVDVDFIDNLNGSVLLHGNPEFHIKVTSDGGVNWTNINFNGGPFDGYVGIFSTDLSTHFVMSYNFLLRTSNAGAVWDTVVFSGYPYANDKEKINDDTLIFTGWDGTFMYQGAITKTYDGGNTWTFLPTNDDYTNFNGTCFITGMKGFGIYSSGWAPDTSYLSMTTDGGLSWNVIHFDTSVTYTDVFMKTQTEGYISLTEGITGKIIFTNDGINYTDDFTSSDYIQRLYHASSTLFAIGSNGLVVKKSVPLGISDNQISNLEIYPNPARDFVQFENTEIMQLSITDINGKTILEKKIQPLERISLENFSGGMYFLRLENQDKINTGKLIIER